MSQTVNPFGSVSNAELICFSKIVPHVRGNSTDIRRNFGRIPWYRLMLPFPRHLFCECRTERLVPSSNRCCGGSVLAAPLPRSQIAAAAILYRHSPISALSPDASARCSSTACTTQRLIVVDCSETIHHYFLIPVYPPLYLRLRVFVLRRSPI